MTRRLEVQLLGDVIGDPDFFLSFLVLSFPFMFADYGSDNSCSSLFVVKVGRRGERTSSLMAFIRKAKALQNAPGRFPYGVIVQRQSRIAPSGCWKAENQEEGYRNGLRSQAVPWGWLIVSFHKTGIL